MKSIQMNKMLATLALATLSLGVSTVSAQETNLSPGQHQESSIYDTEIPSLEAVQTEFVLIKRHSKVRMAIDPNAAYDPASWGCYYDCRMNGLTIKFCAKSCI